jgi:pimeloyl-ACP methyl ester carboxylesterase
LRTTDIGKKFFGNVARAETVKNVLREAYADSNAVTDELVECILKPGLQPGAAEVFLDFISYSGGPLPEDLLPKIAETTPVRILWGRDDPWEIVKEGRKYGEYACVDRFIELPGVGHCPMDEAPDLVNPLLVEFVNDYREVTAGAE